MGACRNVQNNFFEARLGITTAGIKQAKIHRFVLEDVDADSYEDR